MKRILPALLVIVLTLSVAFAADEPKARIAIGDSVAAFRVKDITGPGAGQTLCYRCQYGVNPVACIFTREVTPEVVKLIASLDELVGASKEKNFRCFVVLLTADAEAGAKKLAEVAREKGIKHVPLTLFDSKGPGPYRLSEDAAVTLLQWNKNKLTLNRGFAEAKLSDENQKAFVAEAVKMIGG